MCINSVLIKIWLYPENGGIQRWRDSTYRKVYADILGIGTMISLHIFWSQHKYLTTFDIVTKKVIVQILQRYIIRIRSLI